jgi:ribonuclease D
MKNRIENLEVCEGDLPEGVTFPNGMAAIDAEMMGLNPHRDRLCLVQVGDGNGNVWLVKFSSNNYDAPNLKKLFADNRVTKILHFARTDMVFFQTYLGIMPSPVYCTKIASKLCRTYTDKHGLKNVCSELTGEKMDKEQQCSNWGAPTLTEAQKHYAASDVIYLHEMKIALDERLKSLDRLHLAKQCFDFLPVRANLDYIGWENSDIFAHH